MSQVYRQQECQVCQNNQSRYKCPNCLIFYCSSKCFKHHKKASSQNTQSLCQTIMNQIPRTDNRKQQLEKEIDEQYYQQQLLIKTDNIEDENLRLSKQQLEKMLKNEKLKQMLKSNFIRKKLYSIDNSKMRLNLLQNALLNQEFAHFADQALKTVGKSKKQEERLC